MFNFPWIELMSVKISVIIPVYNSAKFIEGCLKSILSQSFTDFEIIVVNDGSTDNSLEVLDKYRKDIILVDKANGGVSSARNAGLSKAKGLYIAFIDSDDSWHKDKLKIQYDLLESRKELLACCTLNILAPFDQKVDWPDCEAFEVESQGLEEIFAYPYLGTSSFMVRTNVVSTIGGFDESLRTAEDIDLYLKIANLGKIGRINLSLVHKATVQNSLGSLLSSYEDNLFVIERFVDDVNPAMKGSKLYRKVKMKILMDWATDLSWHGKTLDTINKTMDYLSYSKSYNKIFLLFKLVLASLCRVRKITENVK